MAEWVKVCEVDELAPGEKKQLDLDGLEVAVFNVEGEYYVIEDVCTHDYSSLDDGELDGDQIICPRHAARFNVKTGEALTAPAYEAIPTFPVRVEGGIVQVRDDRWD